jgi:flavorubredoxin
MFGRELAPGVRALGAVDWDNRLFDSLIPLPDGTSYNCYLVAGEKKTALIDTVEPSMGDRLLAELRDLPRLDFVVSLHAEQDHSGSIPRVLERFPEATVLCSAKAQGMLGSLLGLAPARVRAVVEGDVLDLGGKTLRFLMTPWVHWPETMSAFLAEDGILFPCDLFGSHLATSDLYSSADPGRVLDAAKRYYAEIMMPFAKFVRKHVERVRELSPSLIAPSHGPVHDHPDQILSAYEEWTGDRPRNRVLLAFVTMHDSTRILVDGLVRSLVSRGVSVDRMNLAVTDIGKLAMGLVDAATVVLGTPTVLNGPHPLAVSAAYLVNVLRPRAAFATVIGSYGWAGKAAETLKEMLSGLSAEWLDPVLCKGSPTPEECAAVDRLAGTIADRHAALGLK